MLTDTIIKSNFNIDDYSNNKRELNIDLIKTILVLGMILSHLIDFFANKNYFINILCSYLNLVSLPGFLFVFGYNSYNAYIKNEKTDTNKKIIKNILKLIIYYYISGYFYELLIEKSYNIVDYIKILCFLKLPGYSEFLLTFALLNVVILVFRKTLKKISEKDIYMIICITMSVLFILIEPIKLEIPYICLILKTNVMSFPLLPYINLFFIGIYFAKNKPKFNKHICVVLYGMLCFHIIMSSEHLTTRFPINLAYISGAYVFVYMYYYIFKFIVNKLKNKQEMVYIAFIRKKQFNVFTY